MKKILALLNVKNWIQTFLLKTLLSKGVKHGVTVVIGLVMGAQVQALLSQYGVSVNPETLQAQLTVLFGGLAGSVINWGIGVLDKDGDGVLG